jgi:hypothetical protein
VYTYSTFRATTPTATDHSDLHSQTAHHPMQFPAFLQDAVCRRDEVESYKLDLLELAFPQVVTHQIAEH